MLATLLVVFVFQAISVNSENPDPKPTADPVTTDPVTTDPVTTDPKPTADPVTTDPKPTADPVTTDPKPTADPVTTDPVTTDPVTTAPPTPDPKDIYVVNQKDGPIVVSIPVPNEYTKLKLNNVEYFRTVSTCKAGSVEIPCTYDKENNAASVKIAEVAANAWVGFEVYKPDGAKKVAGYQTVYFSQGDTWKEVLEKGCIQPQHSSPGLIGAKDLTDVNIRCARKTTCNTATKAGDTALIISVEGEKKCEKAVVKTGTPACEAVENAIDGVDIYEVNVEKPADAPHRTNVYCGTDTSQMSFVIDWTSGVSRLAYVIAPVWALVAMMWM